MYPFAKLRELANGGEAALLETAAMNTESVFI
jgi:hypothetical protein